MKIEVKKTKEIDFNSLSPGDIFYSPKWGGYWIKTYDFGGKTNIAVNLSTGEVTTGWYSSIIKTVYYKMEINE